MADLCVRCGNSPSNHRMLGHPFTVTPTEPMRPSTTPKETR